jgi:phosphodiesterase/alkaline phosphatase D-like protein
VLDTRSRRSSSQGELIDEDQFHQLTRWLLENKSKLKFIVTSVPFVGQLKKPKNDKWCSPIYSKQRGDIIEFLHSNNIEKTVFLTGDMHHSYHASAKIGDSDNSIVVHELMSSPINQFTPDTNLSDTFNAEHSFQTASGLNVTCTITPRSFYGDHSSIMAISVSEDKIKYQVYRTRKTGRPERTGSFSV